MKKGKVIFLVLFLTIFSIHSFPQGNKSPILKFDKKNITLGSSLSSFKKLFPKTKLFDSNSNISIYQVTPENYNLKFYFINDEFNTNNLIALEASCFSDECYLGESSYDVISKQLKNDDRFLHLVNNGEGTKTKYYHYPGYLVIDEQYVGLESGDPAFTFKLIDLNHLELFPSWIELSVLSKLSKLIYSKAYHEDYEKISKIVSHLYSEQEIKKVLSIQMLQDDAITTEHLETWGLEKAVVFTEMDLNKDGVSEYWVEGKFGARMPMQYIYRKVGIKFELIGDIGPVDSWEVKKTYHNGYADINTITLIGAAGEKFVEEYYFNGKNYKLIK